MTNVIRKLLSSNDYLKMVENFVSCPNCQLDLKKMEIKNLTSGDIKKFLPDKFSKIGRNKEYIYNPNWRSSDTRYYSKIFIITFRNNFFHFILHTLSDYFLAKKIINEDQMFKIFFISESKKPLKYNIFFDTLKKFGMNDIIKPVTNDFVNEDTFNNPIDHLIFMPYRFEIYKPLRKIFFHEFVTKIKDISTKRKSDVKTYDNIYISRRIRNNNKTVCNKRRVLINESEVINKLKEYNYVEIFMEDYNFLDKIHILKNAKRIILQGSATSILFPFFEGGNILFLFGPYRLSISPGEYAVHHKIRILQSSDIMYNNHVNSPWKLTASDLVVLEDMIKN